ncbi:MAG: AAA family ATPase [Spiribacter salinus]|uniref:AAA family ATPase n=1 Tax=Spiribacter salinus TaxID=1335746 RepID=A0A540VRS8_9GAMM|nr:MAG: AAA family ATPase [Spiribacter salinus]
MIRKILLKNFKRFDQGTIEFTSGLNMLVGDNDSGKSTLLEAINLGLTKRWNGRFFEAEFSHHFVPASVTAAFLADVHAGKAPQPPEVLVEIYLEDRPSLAKLKGENNSLREDCPGYRLRAALDPDFTEEYQAFLEEPETVNNVPTEFYKIDWTDFAGQPVNVRALRIKASLIDASRIRLHSGADYHLQKIIGDTLDAKQRAQLARSYRNHQESFGANPSIAAINTSLAKESSSITRKSFSMEIDTTGSNGWQAALGPHLDKLPFEFSGSGEQNRLKILLALARRVDESHVILIEEPENHLAFSSLNNLVERVAEQSGDRQVIVATHSSFVVNKLGLNQLMFLSANQTARLTDLPRGTQDYFKKLAGYDTLRLVLAEKVVLVEGPSDELVFQRAYFDRHLRRPIEDGIDVISVRGLSAKRYLDLAIPLERRVVVLADNDGDHAGKVDSRFTDYTAHPFITLARSDEDGLPTLEPQLLGANGRTTVNAILDTDFTNDDDLLAYMKSNKTEVALKFHDATKPVQWPIYIEDAIDALA